METLTQSLCGCGCGQAVQGSRQFLNQRHKLRPRPAPIVCLPDSSTAPRRNVRCKAHGHVFIQFGWKPHGSFSIDWINVTDCPECKEENTVSAVEVL